MDTSSIPVISCSRCHERYPFTARYFAVDKRGRLRQSCIACYANEQQYKHEVIPTTHWRCRKCRVVFERTADHFYHDRQKSDGLSRYCKQCDDQNTNQWRKNNPEKQLAKSRRERESLRADEGRYQASLAHSREASKQYYWGHRQKCLERYHRYYLNNADYHRRRGQKYRRDNPEKMRAQWGRRRALELGADGEHSAADIRLQVRSQTDKRGRLRCWWCGGVIKGGDYHVDHRSPLVRGGSDSAENLVIAHSFCNLSKADKTPAEFAGRLF